MHTTKAKAISLTRRYGDLHTPATTMIQTSLASHGITHLGMAQ